MTQQMSLSDKHILHIITRSDWGGAPRVVKLLAEGTDAKTDVACGPGGRLIDELRTEGIRTFEQPALKSAPDPLADTRTFLSLLSLLWRYEFDLVHCHSTKAGLLGRLAAAMTNTPTIFTVHGWGFYNSEYDRATSAIVQGERLLACVTDEFVCVSQNDLEQGQKHSIICQSDASVIHNGIPSLPSPEDRTCLVDICAIDPDVPILGSIARLAPQKDPLAILRTAKELQDRGRTVQTVIIGSGPLAEDCEKYAAENNIDDVYMLGFREDALNLLFDFDLFLLPSKFEGFPLTVLESLHAGVPLIAYDTGGVSEAIEHGETGLVAPPGDHDSFVMYTEQLLADDARRTEMSERAQAVASKQFSAERMISEYESTYKQILDI